MTPTLKLRYVRREVHYGPYTAKIELVLQQWWSQELWKENEKNGEWRDIPIETEK